MTADIGVSWEEVWKATCSPSVTGGYWVIYGMTNWPSYSTMLVPGTFDPQGR